MLSSGGGVSRSKSVTLKPFFAKAKPVNSPQIPEPTMATDAFFGAAVAGDADADVDADADAGAVEA